MDASGEEGLAAGGMKSKVAAKEGVYMTTLSRAILQVNEHLT